MTVICMWSGPRNLSTAMMRSFGSRPDTQVMDEPFFAPFLKCSGKAHPGRAETLERHEADPDRVAKLCERPDYQGATYSFQKHMPHHMLPGFPMDWARKARHFFLLRHPQRVIASYAKGRAEFDLDDLGFKPQSALYDDLSDMVGTPPPVIDSQDILENPESALSGLCQALDIPFSPHMLTWEAGPRPEDGAWAPYWYHSVENSTGFASAPQSMPEISPEHEPFLASCLPDYHRLFEKRIRV